ncbi:hypothetical protein RchiOBHm_Chr1g0371051 [Rosa chinensis]|uniref:Uncharacterized protein n=1 Tax=Rosa chinensis TaxID=74649 RepID=A0A2P6SLH2_ROSCH|nr:hypothetical protein RchiOBHm_Chr1g0371051 [Rosa chinensis]
MNEVHASSSCLPHCDYLILNTLHSLALQSQRLLGKEKGEGLLMVENINVSFLASGKEY